MNRPAAQGTPPGSTHPASTHPASATPLSGCQQIWDARGFVPLSDLHAAALRIAGTPAATAMAGQDGPEAITLHLLRAFNGARQVQAHIARAARSGDPDAAELAACLRQHGLDRAPCHPVDAAQGLALEARLLADPPGYMAGLSPTRPYPAVLKDEYLAFDAGWTRATLAEGRDRLARFIATRRQDTAVLVGNGPSLAQIDRRLLEGQDVYISNYAIRDAGLHRLARGVAVSNAFVARQAPHLFQTSPLWKFHPLWLGDTLGDTPRTVYLNALGGALFFSPDVAQKIAWHATVTFFWLQILYTAGYRKVCLIGVDNSYQQRPGAREGDLITQTAPDENHFDPGYFRGKVWQAADTGHMARTYALARQHYDADGREIVNCTIGGSLDGLRRAALADELPSPVSPDPVSPDPVSLNPESPDPASLAAPGTGAAPAPEGSTDSLRRAVLLASVRALIAPAAPDKIFPEGSVSAPSATDTPSATAAAPPRRPPVLPSTGLPATGLPATSLSITSLSITSLSITGLPPTDPVRLLSERVQAFLRARTAPASATSPDDRAE